MGRGGNAPGGRSFGIVLALAALSAGAVLGYIFATRWQRTTSTIVHPFRGASNQYGAAAPGQWGAPRGRSWPQPGDPAGAGQYPSQQPVQWDRRTQQQQHLRQPAAASAPAPPPAPSALAPAPVAAVSAASPPSGVQYSTVQAACPPCPSSGGAAVVALPPSAGRSRADSWVFPTRHPPQFNERQSKLRVLCPDGSGNKLNVELESVKITSNTITAYLPGSDGELASQHSLHDYRWGDAKVKLVGQRDWEEMECERKLSVPVVIFTPDLSTLSNVYHVHNDVLLPLYRAIHDLGLGRATSSTTRQPILILPNDIMMQLNGAVSFFKLYTRRMFSGVKTMRDVFRGCTRVSLARLGRPARPFTPIVEPSLYYTTQDLARKFEAMVLPSLLGHPQLPFVAAPRSQWPPRVTLLQRDENRILVTADILRAAFNEVGVPMDTAVFTAGTAAKTQMGTVYNTDILIAVHGAAMAHVLEMPPGSVLVHILLATLKEWQNVIMRRLAAIADVEYVPVLMKSWVYPHRAKWKSVARVALLDAKYYSTLVSDSLAAYLNRHPELKPLVQLPQANSKQNPEFWYAHGATMKRLEKVSRLKSSNCYQPAVWNASKEGCGPWEFADPYTYNKPKK